MAASYPKPDDQKVTRHSLKFDWVALPLEGRDGPVPDLPEWRDWDSRTLGWWAELWVKPQAVMWAQDGSTLFAYACLYDDLIGGRAEAAKVSAEMRQHEDRHGLNPKAMLQLRWRIVEGEPAVERVKPAARRRARLKVV
jgi:hypothetical protein